MLSMIGPYWLADEPNVVGVAYGQYSPSILRPNPLIDRSQSADNGDVIAALTSPGHPAIVMVMLIADHRHQVIIIIA